MVGILGGQRCQECWREVDIFHNVDSLVWNNLYNVMESCIMHMFGRTGAINSTPVGNNRKSFAFESSAILHWSEDCEAFSGPRFPFPW